MNYPNASNETEPSLSRQITRLWRFSPHHVARLIRSLDSQLIRIEHEQRGDEAFLLYVFTVAGKVHSFQVALKSGSVDSIGDLYPAALAFEKKLHEQWGLIFKDKPK